MMKSIRKPLMCRTSGSLTQDSREKRRKYK